MKVFIINLDQSTDRLQQQEKQFKRLGMSFERLPAVSVNDISEEFYLNHIKYGQRLIKQTEMACFLSHKKAWERVILENQPCVILEDDAILTNDFVQVLSAIQHLNHNGLELINLEVQPRKKVVSKTPIHSILHHEYHIYGLYLEKNGTGGYILFPAGAKKLLNRAKKELALADAFIFGTHDLKLYQIEPAVLLQDVICSAYDIPVETPPVSLIGAINNTVAFQPTLLHRLQFKKNRVIEQIRLGIRTLMALTKGEKRAINVNREKFLSK